MVHSDIEIEFPSYIRMTLDIGFVGNSNLLGLAINSAFGNKMAILIQQIKGYIGGKGQDIWQLDYSLISCLYQIVSQVKINIDPKLMPLLYRWRRQLVPILIRKINLGNHIRMLGCMHPGCLNKKEAQQKDPRNNQHSKEILLHPIPSYFTFEKISSVKIGRMSASAAEGP